MKLKNVVMVVENIEQSVKFYNKQYAFERMMSPPRKHRSTKRLVML